MDTRERVLKDLRERFNADILEYQDKSCSRVYITIAPGALERIAVHLFRTLGARFNIASGMDLREHLEILYHFTLEELNLLISLRVQLRKDHPEIVSLAACFEGANWIEREIHELLGVDFAGHPDMRRLLLPDEWPEGVHPLRRDYAEWDPKAIRDRGV